MADPTKYQRGYSFSGFQTNNPKLPLPAPEVDNELENIELSLGQTIDALKSVRRADGKLQNGSVGPDQISPALILGFNMRGTWVPGAEYAGADGVFYENALYAARSAHTSVADQTPDVATDLWRFLFTLVDIVLPEYSTDVALEWPSRAAALASTVPVTTQSLNLAGYSSAGDGGAARYRRVAAPGSPSAWHFQSADGAWWEAIATEWTPEMLGGSLQAAVDAASVLGGSVVATRTYVLTAGLDLRPGVKIDGRGRGVIRRGNGVTGAPALINCSTHSAHGACLEGLTIDGNVANNVLNPDSFSVYVATANDVSIQRCAIINSTGYGIHVTTGLRPKIIGNKVDGIYIYGISISSPTIQTPTRAVIQDNEVSNIGNHAIALTNTDFNEVRGNRVLGHAVTGLVVDISGTTVTITNGAVTTGIRPGNYLIVNGTGGYAEYFITAVNSPSQMTISVSATRTGANGVAGPGDQISISGGSENLFESNQINSGSCNGIVVHNTPAASCQRNKIINNRIDGCGASGISIQASSTATQTLGTSIFGNTISNVGKAWSAGDPDFNVGISVTGTSTSRTFIDGNYIFDQGGVTTLYAINLTTNGGEVFLGKNPSWGCANPGVKNGIVSITPNGFGSTATITGIVSHGDGSYTFTVTANGTGMTASPSVTAVHRFTSISQPPLPVATHVGGSTAPSGVVTYDAIISQTVFLFPFTPTAGATYRVTVKS